MVLVIVICARKFVISKVPLPINLIIPSRSSNSKEIQSIVEADTDNIDHLFCTTYLYPKTIRFNYLCLYRSCLSEKVSSLKFNLFIEM